MMVSIQSLLSGSISAIPAIIMGICLFSIPREEYYWNAYAISTLIYFSASFLLGFRLAAQMRNARLNCPGLWFFVSGGLAWLIALRQDNGDGINTFSLCVLYTVLVTLIYSPLVLLLLSLSALIGGKILSALNRIWEK
jgi:hypothetical protein